MNSIHWRKIFNATNALSSTRDVIFSPGRFMNVPSYGVMDVSHIVSDYSDDCDTLDSKVKSELNLRLA